jgi:hypothetical protein
MRAVEILHRPDARGVALGRILTVRPEGPVSTQEEPEMHPDIIKALMNEHMRELSADILAARRADQRTAR